MKKIYIFVLLIIKLAAVYSFEIDKVSEFSFSETYGTDVSNLIVQDNYLYSLNSRSLQIFEINGNSFQFVNELNLEGSTRKLSLKGNYAYASKGGPPENRLYRIDISDVMNLTITDTLLYLGNYAHFMDGNHLFVHELLPDWTWKMHVYDNDTFQQITEFYVPHQYNTMHHVIDNIGIVTINEMAYLYDISDPFNIELISENQIGITSFPYQSIIIQDSVLVYGDHYGIRFYDTIELPSPEEDDGWKWLSFPALDVVLDDADIAENVLYDIMQLPIPAILDKVLAQDYVIEYDLELDEWLNDWRQFLRTEGFKFHMNDSYTLDVPGFKVADNTTIVLDGNNVENWVGYWLDETQHVSDAFSEYWNGSNIHYIQHQYWAATYWEGQWLEKVQSGHEPTLSYGDMVIVKCVEDIQNFRWDNSTPEDEKTVYPKTEYFTFEEQADYTPIYIELDKNNMPQEIGAIVNGECIGATVVEDTLTQINAYTTSVPPGNIELELYYGGRSENQHISSYNCVSYSYPNIVMKQLSTKKSDDAWFIDLREDSSMVPAPTKVSLSNYPNPFNPTTTISYSLPQEGKVSLKIYNVKGQFVKILIDGSQPEGYYEVVWNGKDNAGRSVASGIYYYRINACGKTINKKMLLLK